jgi:phosphoribosylamine--glycine ligase
MNILIIGSGGREHTLAWKLSQSPLCNQLYIAPGNAGTANCGTNLNISVSDFDNIRNAIVNNNISLVIVGPEDPLVKGITDFLASDDTTKHVNVIGPGKEAAMLEGSKSFAKTFMNRYNIPTAKYTEFTIENYEAGVEYIKQHSLPIVLKADGLAAGKGVLICQSYLEALAEFELMIMRSKFGEAGKKVVVEEFLRGIEMSVFVLTDGKHYLLLPEAKDYKRIGEADKGLNTGGMGAVSPLPFFNEELKDRIRTTIIEPTIAGFAKEGLNYRGFVFFGLMVNNGDPYMIEYNCRMGDPETEVVIPRIENDLVEIFSAVADQSLDKITLSIDSRAAAVTVAVSGGYPGEYVKGKSIEGLETDAIDNTIIFHAGTALNESDGSVITNGGRVLAVTALGDNIKEAAELSAYMMEQLYFEDMYFRRDIGYEFT